MSKSAPTRRRWYRRLRPSRPDPIVTLTMPESVWLRIEEALQKLAAAGDLQLEWDLFRINRHTDRV